MDFLVKYKKIIISDNAGMGKSTLMKWIVRQCIKKHLGIPVLIELKKITPTNSIVQEIFNQFGQLGEELDNAFILKLLGLGKFIIIFDGYDEIADASTDFATADILSLVNKAPDNFYIVTSRPDPALTTFGKFKGFNIKNLEPEQSNSIIRKCDKYSPEAIGEELIRDARLKENTITDFLTNPFLVTLLYNCYFYNKNIPINKSEFYEEIYTALFKKHDLSKEKFERKKRSGLDSIAFRQVLRKLAFNSAKKGVNDFSETSLVEAINEAQKTLVGIPVFDAIHFYEDLVKQVPLMVREGLHIKWSHKSLQDYFAAESICQSENKAQIINSIYNSKNFYRNANLFEFVIEQDYALVREHILYGILIQFRGYVEHIKQLNPELLSSEAEDLGSSSFDYQIFASKEDLMFAKTTFQEINSVAIKPVTSVMHNEVYFNGKKVYLFLSHSVSYNVLSMIFSKRKDDLFVVSDNYRKINRYNFPDEIDWNANVINLSSDRYISIQDAEFRKEYFKFLQNNTYYITLDYDKAMNVLRDIENIKIIREQENASAF